MMVGQSAADLTDAHPSVQRCLKETKLDGMSDGELRLIIEGRATKLKLTFTLDVVREIIKMSSGYPHFTHLLALKVRRGRNRGWPRGDHKESLGNGCRAQGRVHCERVERGSVCTNTEAGETGGTKQLSTAPCVGKRYNYPSARGQRGVGSTTRGFRAIIKITNYQT